MTFLKKLLEKINSKDAVIGIVGLGYVGLPLSIEFSTQGFNVIGFDIDEKKVEKLRRGQSYVNYISKETIKAIMQNGLLQPTSDFSKLSSVDVIIICVPTPINEYREPDLSFVINTANTILKYLQKGWLVVLESTTYPGTTEEQILPILETTGLKVGEDFFVSFSPERVDPGNKDFTQFQIPKIVSGITSNCQLVVKTLYDQIFIKTVPVSSPKVAEAAKLLENIFRAVNIALVNEMKIMLERMGIDIWEVIEAASTKPFGFTTFYPGPGLGGHCIPIDPYYLSWKARRYEIPTRFIELAGQINSNMPYHVVSKISDGLNVNGNSLNGSRVLVLGISYKEDINDTRESPALKIISILKEKGASVEYNDPYVPLVCGLRNYPELVMKTTPLQEGVLQGFDCVVIVTAHSTYNWQDIANQSKLVVDTRNVTKYVIDGMEKIVYA
ncbi:MAG: nucleotide sugar dehydrogenase [Thermodesulfobacteriota bacterium]